MANENSLFDSYVCQLLPSGSPSRWNLTERSLNGGGSYASPTQNHPWREPWNMKMFALFIKTQRPEITTSLKYFPTYVPPTPPQPATNGSASNTFRTTLKSVAPVKRKLWSIARYAIFSPQHQRQVLCQLLSALGCPKRWSHSRTLIMPPRDRERPSQARMEGVWRWRRRDRQWSNSAKNGIMCPGLFLAIYSHRKFVTQCRWDFWCLATTPIGVWCVCDDGEDGRSGDIRNYSLFLEMAGSLNNLCLIIWIKS